MGLLTRWRGLFCWGILSIVSSAAGGGQGVSLRPRGGGVSGSLLWGFSWRAFGCLLWLCVLVGVVVD